MKVVVFDKSLPTLEHDGVRQVQTRSLRYSEDQPRDEHGRFGSGGESKVEWVPDNSVHSDAEFVYEKDVKLVPIEKVVGGEQMNLPQTHVESKVNQFAKKMEKGGAKFKAIAVNPPDKNGNYKIRDGHHRWLAAQQAGLKTIGVHEFVKYEPHKRSFNSDQPRDKDGKFSMGNVASFKNEKDGVEAHVTSYNGKFHVNMFDTDSGQALPSSIYSGEGAKDKAIGQAKKLAGVK